MLTRICAPLLLAVPALAQGSFQGLGSNGAQAFGITPDGQFVTGIATGGTFVWDALNGLQIVEPQLSAGGVHQCSANAQFGCGTYVNPSTQNQEAARWGGAGGLQYLGGLASQSGTSLSTAYAIDDAGTTIVGLGWVTAGTAHAFKWTLAGGMTDLGASPGGYSSRANGISGDGSVVVGWDWGSPRHPVYWAGGSMHQLGNGILSGEAWSASVNGSVISGVYGNELFRWTQATGTVQLGKLPGSAGSDQAIGLDMSADGSTIVGINGSVLGTGFHALLWRADLGLVDLKNFLVTHGLSQVSGWTLQSATGISADGTIVTGYGFNPSNQVESWIATLPPASPLVTLCEPGVGGVASCPCSNPPAGSARGCDNSAATGGASISASGVPSVAADTLVIATAGQRPSGTSILLQGTTQNAGTQFGQGLRCVGGTLKRLYVKNASGGSISVPGAGDPTISARSAAVGDVILAATTRYYMVYYRDPIVLGGCSAILTYNATSGGAIYWYP